MIQGRGGFGFAAEAFKRLGIVRQEVRQELQRDEAVQADVLRFVNDTHAPAAEPFQNAVMG